MLRMSNASLMKSDMRRPGWGIFTVNALVGVAVAIILLGILAVGECLPRDNNIKMQACEIAKRRDIYIFISCFVILFLTSICMQVKRSNWACSIALGSGIVALIIWKIIEAMLHI
ncbi:hypothetical protein [Sphingobium lactosutens]|uniref:hypothetical protein n=1 Tax=Sphingobium lactosutens TaxID=522773 RepID=UPI0015B7D88A|nr:hypothetical protein [Sphingobium lactosutens]